MCGYAMKYKEECKLKMSESDVDDNDVDEVLTEPCCEVDNYGVSWSSAFHVLT
jgi:hypothetical protein